MDLFQWLILGLLAGAHFVGLRQWKIPTQWLDELQSFAAGVAIGYVFLVLFPELSTYSVLHGIDVWSLITVGLVGFHMAMKLIFRNSHGERRFRILSEELHLLTAVLYNFLISYSIVKLAQSSLREHLFLVVLVILHTVLSEISHPDQFRHWIIKIKQPLLSFVSLLGGLVAINELLSDWVTAVMYALTAGAVIFISIREEIPQKQEGRPIFLMFGVMITWLLLRIHL